MRNPAACCDARLLPGLGTVTVGTFNIRLFPDRETVPQAVAERLAELGADVVMVQEIRDASAFDAVLAEVSASTGRDYDAVLGPMCRGTELRVGVVFDRKRFSLSEHREQVQLDPQGRCSCRDGHPPALLAVLDAGGQRLAVMSVHLQFGARRWQYRARREQWEELVASMDRVEQEFGVPLVIGGDFNSTGWSDDDRGERRFIQAMAQQAGAALATVDVGCTAYWQPNRRTRQYIPSMLDHVLVRGGTVLGAESLGMCAALGGQPRADDEGNPDFERVSDHCPVRVELSF